MPTESRILTFNKKEVFEALEEYCRPKGVVLSEDGVKQLTFADGCPSTSEFRTDPRCRQGVVSAQWSAMRDQRGRENLVFPFGLKTASRAAAALAIDSQPAIDPAYAIETERANVAPRPQQPFLQAIYSLLGIGNRMIRFPRLEFSRNLPRFKTEHRLAAEHGCRSNQEAVMKNPYEVLRVKEQRIRQLRREMETLRFVIGLFDRDNQTDPTPDTPGEPSSVYVTKEGRLEVVVGGTPRLQFGGRMRMALEVVSVGDEFHILVPPLDPAPSWQRERKVA